MPVGKKLNIKARSAVRARVAVREGARGRSILISYVSSHSQSHEIISGLSQDDLVWKSLSLFGGYRSSLQRSYSTSTTSQTHPPQGPPTLPIYHPMRGAQGSQPDPPNIAFLHDTGD